MSNNVPWSIKAVEPETWDAAREAARRAGLSVGEWLDAAIRGSAKESEPSRSGGTRADSRLQHQLDDISDRLDRIIERNEPRTTASRVRPEAAIVNSIDALTDRIDSLIHEIRAEEHGAPYQIKTAIDRLDSRIETAFAQNRSTQAPESEIERKLSELARQIETMDRRIALEGAQHVVSPRTAPTIAELDAAIAEITVRQAALEDGAHSRDLDRKLAAIDQRFGFPPRSDTQLAGIEQQIKLLADEMQALRRASAQADTVEQLRREVSDLAKTIGELTPRRSIEALERTVAGLARRIDRMPYAEGSGDNGEIARALNEIHRSLAEVKPAESFSAVEQDLKALSEKLDSLSERGLDSATVNRLQAQTSEIRELLANALPGEALKTLVGQIETVMHRIEHMPSQGEGALMEVVSSLERRIDDFAGRVEAASRQPATSPLLDEIKARLEQIEAALARGDRGAPGGLEATMQSLLEKLDAAESRLAKLGTIEHGMNDLFGQLREIRSNAIDVVERASLVPTMESLAPERTERREAPQFEARETRVELRETKADPKPLVATRELSVTHRGEPRPIAHDPDTTTVSSSREGDLPLEPGSGFPRKPVQSAVERVALSEAALGGLSVRPAELASTADYIAAARRAAQAAASRQPETESAKQKPKKSWFSFSFGSNRRTLVLALLFLVVAFGAVRFGGLAEMIPFMHSDLKPEPLTKPKPPVSAPGSAPGTSAPKAPAAEPRRSEAAPVAQPAKTEPAKTEPEKGAAPDRQSSLPAAEISATDIPATDMAATKMIAPNLTASLLSANIAPETTASIPATAPVPPASNPAIAPAPSDTGHASLPASIGATGLRMAALAGDPAAAYEIGSRWFDGRGVPANPAEAKRWFETAERAGSLPAAYRLGNLYEKGLGTPKNLAEARRYYTEAAEGGNLKAMHNLAVLAAEGGDGKPDFVLAARWFRIAADHNVRDSQYNLGVLYARGFGVEKNFAESYRWFALAAAQGDDDSARKRDEIAKRLDAQALATVKEAVALWKPTPADEAANEVKPRPEWEKALEPSAPAKPGKKTAKR